MCLAIKYDKVSKRKTGYKLLHTYSLLGGQTYETGQCGVSRIRISTEKFTTDPNEAELSASWDGGFTYLAGFHIFLSKQSALRVQSLERVSTVLCKVAFREPVAYGEVKWNFIGKSHPFRTVAVVARQCKILEVMK